MDLKDLKGQILAGRFRLHELLGQGGYGAVFDAEQLSVHRRCAVKVLFPRFAEAEDVTGRFKAEAIATSRLHHPNSVIIYDFGHDRSYDLLFLAMEYLEGESLSQLIDREGALSVDRTLYLAGQIAASLQDAHQQGVVHRDLKPHNVMVIARGGDADFIKVIDFGIAKVMQETSATMEKLTMTGMMVGTPQYMAPEQIRDGEVDGRTDLYALAICIYKMLLGRTPFQGGAPLDVAIRQLTDRPLPLRGLNPDIPVTDAFELALLRAMEKEQARRYDDIVSFINALQEARAQFPPDLAARAATASPPLYDDEPSGTPSQPMEVLTSSINLGDDSAPGDAPDDAPDNAPAPPAQDEAPGHTVAVHSGQLQHSADAPQPEAAHSPPPAPQTPAPDEAPAATQAVRLAPSESAPEPAPPAPRATPTVTTAEIMAPPAPLYAAEDLTPRAAPRQEQPRTDSSVDRSQRLLLGAVGVSLSVLGVAVALLLTRSPDPPASNTPSHARATTTSGSPPPSITSSAAPTPATTAGTTPPSPPDPAPDLGAHVDLGGPSPDMGAPSPTAPPEPTPKPAPTPKIIAKPKPRPKPKPKPTAEPPKPGTVRVVLIPFGELLVDSKSYGKKSRQTLTLPAGKHTLALRQGGDIKASKTLTLAPGSTQTVRLKAN